MVVLSGLYAGLSVLSLVLVVAALLYASLDVFAPRGSWMTFDFRVIGVIFSMMALVVLTGVGVLGAGLGLLLSARGVGAALWPWWAGLLALFGAEFVLGASLALLSGDFRMFLLELILGG